MTWTYPSELAEALLRFGLRPTPATPPTLVRDALSQLYRYELRRMRDRLVAGEMDKAAYVELVIATRKRYWPLSLQPSAWESICRFATPS
jgi:hypothetical protein